MATRKRTANVTAEYTHDAWNRLVKVVMNDITSSSATLTENEYKGLHWRTVKRSDTSTPLNGLDKQSIMYYDASWRLVEERIDDNWSTSSSTVDRHMQNLWGARYIDDLVARRRDADHNGSYTNSLSDATWYALTDVQFSVVAMLTITGKLHERVAYDSYGTARHHWKDDVDGDGDADSADKSIVTSLSGKLIYQSGYNADADIDRSGKIDSTDAGLVTSGTKAALVAGESSDRSGTGPDNVVGYDGYVFNPDSLLYTVRFRHYDSGLGRWLERDPLGYIDSQNLYLAVGADPIVKSDPMGLGPPDDMRDPSNLPNANCWQRRGFRTYEEMSRYDYDERSKPKPCDKCSHIVFKFPGDSTCDMNGVSVNNIMEAAAYIRNNCAGCTVSTIAFAGHAGSGQFLGGKTKNGAPPVWSLTEIDFLLRRMHDYKKKNCDQLRQLLAEFDAYDTLGKAKNIYLFGCHVASDDEGREFLQLIADLTGARVEGPICEVWDSQWGGGYAVTPGLSWPWQLQDKDRSARTDHRRNLQRVFQQIRQHYHKCCGASTTP